jgi:hypothetical protein
MIHAKQTVAARLRGGGGLGEGTPLFLKILTEFSHIGFLPKVEKVIFSYFGAKVTGKSSWKTEKSG